MCFPVEKVALGSTCMACQWSDVFLLREQGPCTALLSCAASHQGQRAVLVLEFCRHCTSVTTVTLADNILHGYFTIRHGMGAEAGVVAKLEHHRRAHVVK